jgi:polysaccharide deacetylase family protein (PEP-CTERM system associated)
MTIRDKAMPGPVILSFDIEEHHRIEAAALLSVPGELQSTYAQRMEATTRRLLDQLASHQVPASFYIVGEIARSHPKLVQDISAAGHEIGTHSYQHLRIHRMTPQSFAEDLRRSIDTLSQCAGVPVVGFRAPTFSVTRLTAWAVDVLVESGLKYDSSIFSVRHDRYGVPDAPRFPYWLQGSAGRILELPPLTYRGLGRNWPVAGGGYFRLFPLACLKAGVAQMQRANQPSMLYVHPWEFDPGQPELPLKAISRFRTYHGIANTTKRLDNVLKSYKNSFRRAVDVVGQLEHSNEVMQSFTLTAQPKTVAGAEQAR